jgi:hypothetical protein
MEGIAMFANIIFVSSPADLLGPILTVVIIWIAYNQYKINKDKLHLDLFSNRFSVYTKLLECFSRILINHKVTDQDVYNITTIKEEAFFLFDKNIYDFIVECHTKFGKLNQYEKMQLFKMQQHNLPKSTDPLTATQEYQQLQEYTSIYAWIRVKFEELKYIFKPYLHF